MRLVKGAFTALPCKSIVLSMFLVALLVGVSGAGVSGTRVHVPTRSASPASLPGGDHPARMLWHRAAGGPGAPPAVRIVVCRSRLCRADPGQLRSTRRLALHRDQPTPLARAFDAYRALEYLAALGSIDPGRAVLQGHSHGGATVGREE
jgi:hypothetical protein